MRKEGKVTRAARLLRVLRDEFGATVPEDISEGAVGDSILSMVLDSVGQIGSDLIEGNEPELRYMGTGRIYVAPEWDKGHLVGFQITVEV